jgi:endonuclease-3 related protein
LKKSLSLTQIYERLFKRYGPQYWWPTKTLFEVIVGAILTQSTAWTNVEKAIENLRRAVTLSPEALQRIPEKDLAVLIHSCGYYNVKARKLKAFVNWFGGRYDFNLEKMFATDTMNLRGELLGVYGIGEETADSILLYAGNKPIFVIDAYTRRIVDRLGLAPESNSYSACQNFFMANLPPDAALFNEYHALFVRLGKEQCRKKPVCEGCCLRGECKGKLKLKNQISKTQIKNKI